MLTPCWMRLLPESARLHQLVVGDTHRLELASLQAGDWGRYRCSAANRLGEASAVVEVTGKPGRPAVVAAACSPGPHSYQLVWTTRSAWLPLTHQVRHIEDEVTGWQEINCNKN